MEKIFVDFKSFYINQFEKHLNVPASTIHGLRDESTKIYIKEENKDFAIEKIAENARLKLDIQNNKELLYKLEIAGIYILEKDMGQSYRCI